MPVSQAEGFYQLLNAEPARAGLEAQVIAQVGSLKPVWQPCCIPVNRLFFKTHTCADALAA